MPKLILLGGPPGVGKSTVLRLMKERLDGVGILDADDVWRVSRNVATEENGVIAINNVIGVMRGYFEAGCELGIVSWVFARSALYDPVKSGLCDVVERVDHIYLTASKKKLEQRLKERNRLGVENDPIKDVISYSISRLELIDSLPYAKIDTSGMSPEKVAAELLVQIKRMRSAD
ncbi:MAG: AAA family ATPase [Pseudomonadales bacterium]|jgi:gluconate kinase|nr:hypothetical protein [Gammaproteobacteria bacterium]MDP6025116.1 AAA family ATPase [Pseudomonadales bacterium]MDP6315641.1 AAA family ATPase [Pseudomonadales bacterium]MDP7313553.1 AAA family ATPase [Pseudomonadales bacterium]MDP7576000.1 AAA family ATPase [Pseudomonadales bacterium]|tara:strand:- start:23544 stop:24068 length:525 start_codon:yes stop_codon:yes gene_type:complete